MDRRTAKRYRRIRQLRIRAASAAAIALALLTAMIAVSAALNAQEQAIRVRFGQKNYSVSGEEGEQYYTSDYSDPEELREDGNILSRQIAEEGIVLLRNQNSTLPLADGAKISVFGEAAVNPVYSESAKYSRANDGGTRESGGQNLSDALSGEGFEVNERLWSFARRGGGVSFSKRVLDSISDYSDAALVVIGREGAGTEASVHRTEADSEAADEQGTEHALQLTEEEKTLLQTAGDSCSRVVVVLNADNPVEMGFLDEYDVDACIWTGTWGEGTAAALAEVLSGSVNPSGRLPDTYVYDDLSAPASVNLGDFTIENSTVAGGTKYLAYQEGIYIGYRYYETRYEDAVSEASGKGSDNASDNVSDGQSDSVSDGTSGSYDYTSLVACPFGYGLSYTSFVWSDFDVDYSKGVYTVSVQVTNSGNTAGADVVEIYLQKPYSDREMQDSVEVPAVELVGFARTDVLAAGASQTVSVAVDREEFRTYDANDAKTYILEEGNYYLTAAGDAHEAVNNILAAKGTPVEELRPAGEAGDETALSENGSEGGGDSFVYRVQQESRDTQTYAVSSTTGAGIQNRFSAADPSAYNSDYKGLTRSNWRGTVPSQAYQGGSYSAPSALLAALNVSSGENSGASSPVYNTVHGEERQTLASLRGTALSDYHWSWLLDQMTWRETYTLVRKGGGVINEVLTCSAPQAVIRGGSLGTLYPSATVLAATWDTELIGRMAELIGEEALAEGVSVWETPSLNLHRTPLGDEDGKCYSEDSFLSGEMGAAVCRGLSGKGVIPLLGRFVLADQATNYRGVAVLADEQTIRELYLKSFEKAIGDGGTGSMAVMAAMNRIGGRWCGGSGSLLTQVLRGEWGFSGIVMTDTISGSRDTYCDILEGLEAGTDVWQNTSDNLFRLRGAQLTYGVRESFRTAAGRILRTVSQSNAMNGIGTETTLRYHMAGWKYWRNIADVLIVLIAGAFLWYAQRQWRRAGRIREKLVQQERKRRREAVQARVQRERKEREEMERMENL